MISMSNVDDSNEAIFQCDEVLKKLNTMYGHAFKNVLKRRKSFINGAKFTPTINISIIEAIHVGINVEVLYQLQILMLQLQSMFNLCQRLKC